MRRLVLCGLSLLGVGLATWASQPDTGSFSFVSTAASLPAAFGAIHPRISPDGRQIAFSYQGAIWRIPRDGGTATRLTDGAGLDIEPAWSPDGARIAFANSPRMRGGEVRVIAADSGQPVAVPQRVDAIDSSSFSRIEFHPDGRLFGNLRMAGKPPELTLVDLATGQSQSIVKTPPQSRFALSRDGKWVAYSSTMDVDGQQAGNDGPQADIWKIATTGGEPARVTRFGSRIFDLCWSADGKALFLVSDLGGAHNDIWRVPIDDPEGGARRITSGQADEERPSLSSDGRWLAYSDNRTGSTALMVRDLRSGIDATVPIAALDFRRPVGTLQLKSRDKTTGRAAVARVAIVQEQGKPIAPPGALYRMQGDNVHFYCDGMASFTLPAGRYRLRAWHGPEYRPVHRDVVIEAGRASELAIDLERWANPAEKGWHSGENHIHANYGYGEWYNTPESMLAQCSGEDLRVCNLMVANSDTDGVFDREFFRGRPDPLSTGETILHWNQEFRSTSWGHMTLVNLGRLVEPIFTGFKDTTNPWDVPTNSDIADRTHQQQGLVNYTHPARNPADPYLGAYTAKGIPVDVALGKIDTLDLNGGYQGTVPLWHRLLNCGFRLNPSAGTDCFLNRIGSQLPGVDRAYVKIDGPLGYKAWIEGLKAGRSFVTNGPMLEFSVESKGPGETVRLAAPREVRVVAKASSQFPLAAVELIQNGKAVSSGKLSADRLQCEIDVPLAVAKSGWISLRATGPGHPDHPAGSLEAHASPVHIEVAGKPTASREDAEFFLKWIERLSLDLRVRDRAPDLRGKQHIESQLEAARQVYVKIAQNATE